MFDDLFFLFVGVAVHQAKAGRHGTQHAPALR